METLVKRILERDRTAIQLARQLGPAANTALTKLLDNSDPEVREITLACLNETGGDDAMRSFLRALSDSDPQARAAAINGVRKHFAPPFFTPMMDAYDKSKDPYVRKQILLAAGTADGSDYVVQLKRRCSNEANADLQEGCVAAMARLGDATARAEFVRRLQSSTGRALERYFEYCDYIHADWLLKPLSSFLSDKTNLVYIGVDNRPDLTQYLRTCDVALNLIASISGHKFHFPVDPGKNYSDAELAEARAFVEALR